MRLEAEIDDFPTRFSEFQMDAYRPSKLRFQEFWREISGVLFILKIIIW